MPKRPPKNQAQQLRIIGGQWRGRKLAIADVEGLRPTGDRIRETLFNWLMPIMAESYCLDLFSGSGALGLECLSRGAKQATLLEKNAIAAKQLQEHCKTLNADGGHVIQIDALTWLNTIAILDNTVDIVFIDPPFADNLWEETINSLENSGILKENAAIYIETPKNTQIAIPANWLLHREKQSGQIHYRLYYREVH